MRTRVAVIFRCLYCGAITRRVFDADGWILSPSDQRFECCEHLPDVIHVREWVEPTPHGVATAVTGMVGR